VSGYYTSASEVTLNNGITLPITAGTPPGFDAFIVKYHTSGVAQWATTIRGLGGDFGYGITTDSTGVYVSGDYTSDSEVTLNNGITLPITARASPSATPGQDAFIVKYNTSGVAQWATTIRGTGGDAANSITADSTGVYAIGYYTSSDPILLTNGS
jgi:maltoporin